MILRIINLRLRTVVGIYEWEKNVKQDIVINVEIEFEGDKAIETDNISDSVDYKKINKEIISTVENSEYNLIEKICGDVSDIVLKNNGVNSVTVRVDKPGALRFTDSVSIEITKYRKDIR